MCEKYAFSHMSGGSCRNQVNRGPPWWWSYWEMQKERNETLGTSLSPYSWRHLHKGFSWIKTLLCPRMMDQLSSKVERCMLTKPSSPEPHTVNFHRRATAENKIPPTLKVRKGKPHINLEIASQGIWAQCPATMPLFPRRLSWFSSWKKGSPPVQSLRVSQRLLESMPMFVLWFKRT